MPIRLAENPDVIVKVNEVWGLEGRLFLQFLDENGYTDLRMVGDKNDTWVGIHQYMFTSAIMQGTLFDYTGIDDRWCYSTYEKSSVALGDWDGVNGEPTGWHRHPATGRRVSEDGEEYINL